MAAPNIETANVPQTVAGQGVVIDGTTLDSNGSVIGTSVLGPITFSGNITLATGVAVANLTATGNTSIGTNLSWTGNLAISGNSTITHKIPVTVSGNVYYIALTTNQ
jgi:hypothetical protein